MDCLVLDGNKKLDPVLSGLSLQDHALLKIPLVSEPWTRTLAWGGLHLWGL